MATILPSQVLLLPRITARIRAASSPRMNKTYPDSTRVYLEKCRCVVAASHFADIDKAYSLKL